MRLTRLLLLFVPVLAACSSAHGSASTAGEGGGETTSDGTGASGGGASTSSSGSSTTSSTSSSTTSSSGSSTTSSTSSSSGSGGSGGGPSGNACSHTLPEYTSNDGSVTYYTFGGLSAVVNCGFDVTGATPDAVAQVATGNGKYFGAMNTADYDDAATCGACVEITRDGTKKVVVTIVDQCPSASNTPCKPGHIDLSEEAFAQLGDPSEGYLGTGNGGAVGLISWRYVACPVTGGISFRLKERTNAYWNQILVEGHRYAIAKVEVKVNGSWVAAVRQSYNYWQAGSGDMGMPPYDVRVTDVNGDTIETTLALQAGDQGPAAQFPMCM